MNSFRLLSAAAATALAFTTSATAAPLIGQSVTGSIATTSSTGATVVKQFPSPAIVGSGIEFSGSIDVSGFGFPLDFNIDADLSNTALVLHFTDPTRVTGNVSGSSNLLTLSFGSDAAFPGIASTVHSCDASAGFCASNPNIFPTVTSSASSISIGFKSVFAGDIYTLTFSPAAPAVPETATWAMMALGFGLVGAGLRSRNKVRTTISVA